MPRPEQDGNQPPQNGIVDRYIRGLRNIRDVGRDPEKKLSRRDAIDAFLAGGVTVAVGGVVVGAATEAGRGVVLEDEANAQHDLIQIPGVGVRDTKLLAATGQDIIFSYDATDLPEAAKYGSAGAVKVVVTTGEPGYLRIGAEEIVPEKDKGWLDVPTYTIDGSAKILHPVVGILPKEQYNVYVATIGTDTTFDGFQPLPARQYAVSRIGDQPDGLHVQFTGIYELPVREPLRTNPTP